MLVRMSRWFVVLAWVLGSSLAGVAWAQGDLETPEEQARRSLDLNRTVMSPFCPGRTLDGCPSPNAAAWRDDIRTWIKEGKSNEEIRKLLNQRTDQDLTGAPSTALDSVLPILVSVLAVLLLVLLLRVLLKPGSSPTPPEKKARAGTRSGEPVPGADPRAIDQRLEDELRNLDD